MGYWKRKNSSYPIRLCKELLDMINTHSLTQTVDLSTRNNNILNIFATNRPTLIKQCYLKAGISDQETPIQQGYKQKLCRGG